MDKETEQATTGQKQKSVVICHMAFLICHLAFGLVDLTLLENGSASDRFQGYLNARLVETGRWRSRSLVECCEASNDVVRVIDK